MDDRASVGHGQVECLRTKFRTVPSLSKAVFHFDHRACLQSTQEGSADHGKAATVYRIPYGFIFFNYIYIYIYI
jgi:hypothetical protein